MSEVTIQTIIDDFGLSGVMVGGVCIALSTDLNTNQDVISITGKHQQPPTDSDDDFNIAVYLNEQHNEPAHTFNTSNIEHLYELMSAVFELWGN